MIFIILVLLYIAVSCVVSLFESDTFGEFLLFVARTFTVVIGIGVIFFAFIVALNF